jgi:hypothetical protein
LLGPGERLFGVDHPIDVAEWLEIGVECSLVGEAGMGAEELQATGVVGGGKHLQKQAAEQGGENLLARNSVAADCPVGLAMVDVLAELAPSLQRTRVDHGSTRRAHASRVEPGVFRTSARPTAWLRMQF